MKADVEYFAVKLDGEFFSYYTGGRNIGFYKTSKDIRKAIVSKTKEPLEFILNLSLKNHIYLPKIEWHKVMRKEQFWIRDI